MEAAAGRTYLLPALWLPTLGVATILLVERYRRFWVRFGRYVGLGWMAFGIALYLVYRRRQHLPLTVSVERKFEEH